MKCLHNIILALKYDANFLPGTWTEINVWLKIRDGPAETESIVDFPVNPFLLPLD